MRELEELTTVDDPAWPALEALFAESAVPPVVLPADDGEARRGLLQLQISARSALGGLVLNCGGLLVDEGWVRVYGAGSSSERRMPSLAEVNAFPADFDPEWHPAPSLVVGHDVLGGVFALNGHDPAAEGRPGVPGQMTYFAPDSLEWEELRMGHSTWLSWLLSGRLEQFYEGMRWPGWQQETGALAWTEGINFFPPLWSEEAHADLPATSRKAVPMGQVLGVAVDFARQMGPADPGFLGTV
ncbi:DUF2625 family protein [Actinospica durhamensis]|uniref:DUF2625 family protein n=1 Tax=Actinospica durhamensis TaxID=1508375 RepID=A0A941INC5_9ACTN|nr:DUF2625 family protein [Actinospica durhamensis]MBR7831867.1 DUF2625 family protein [Actinospica durhamensis]